MVTIRLPEQILERHIEPEAEVSQVPNHLVKELEELVERTEAGPELVHWFHFVPCAGVRYYTYHTSPSPVEPLVRRKD